VREKPEERVETSIGGDEIGLRIVVGEVDIKADFVEAGKREELVDPYSGCRAFG